MKKADIYLLTHADNPRLSFVLHYVFERLNLTYAILRDPEIDQHYDALIVYHPTITIPGAYSIPYSGYLELPLEKLYIPTIKKDFLPYLFSSKKNETFPFDLFSAIFFMLSRVEEYLIKDRDKHQRFDAFHSFLYPHGLHRRALVDEWLMYFKKSLQHHFPSLQLTSNKAGFSLTMDIDQLFSYKAKGLKRQLGGWFRDLLRFNFSEIIIRFNVIRNTTRDPFDIYADLAQFLPPQLLPIKSFILASENTTKFDKNTSYKTAIERQAIHQLKQYSILGWHSSYYSQKSGNFFQQEKTRLEKLLGTPIFTHRSHYLRLSIPTTYQILASCQITEDYTMGYASDIGFRAGTGHAFPFYDLTQEKVIPLRIFPFSVMDGTLVDYLHLSLSEAEKLLYEQWEYVKQCESHMSLLVHNETFSDQGRWKGWKNMLFRFFEDVSKSL